MKKLFTIACTLVLGSALSFAQATQTPPASGTTGTSTTKSDTKTKKHSHSKKGGKKSKKSSGDSTATPATEITSWKLFQKAALNWPLSFFALLCTMMAPIFPPEID